MRPKEPPKGSFGTWLDHAIREKNMSGYEFAKIIGFAESTISAHIRGVKHPNMNSIRKYARYFGVNEYDLAQLVTEDVKSREIGDTDNEAKK